MQFKENCSSLTDHMRVVGRMSSGTKFHSEFLRACRILNSGFVSVGTIVLDHADHRTNFKKLRLPRIQEIESRTVLSCELSNCATDLVRVHLPSNAESEGTAGGLFLC